MASLIDHVFLTATNMERSIAFYTNVLSPMGITGPLTWKAASSSSSVAPAPPNHPPELHGFGRDRRIFFWLKPPPPPPATTITNGSTSIAGGNSSPSLSLSPSHIGFACKTRAEVDACYAAAMAAGGTSDDEAYGGRPSVRRYYADDYYAGSVRDPDGHEIEFTFKAGQHPCPGTD